MIDWTGTSQPTHFRLLAHHPRDHTIALNHQKPRELFSSFQSTTTHDNAIADHSSNGIHQDRAQRHRRRPKQGTQNRGTRCQAPYQQIQGKGQQAHPVRSGDCEGGFWTRTIRASCHRTPP